ncbi:helix-turn-helix domain-containing protein [Streptomyces sp. SGAir0957]
MTTAVRQAPHHRNLTCLKNYNCRRPECLARSAEYDRTRNRLVAYGRWQPFVDAEPVRQHIRMLMSHGIGWQRVARLAGVSCGAVSRILYGAPHEGAPRTKRVRTTTADKILAIKPSFEQLAPMARVDGTGTRRRLQALIANGWPQKRLGAEMGIQHHRLIWDHVRQDVVAADTVRRVAELYERLWNVDPATRGVHPRFVDEAKRRATANGWAPPAAWDDDYIDSPAATPDLGEHVDRYTSIAEDARWLINTQGYTPAQAAHRLGVTKSHLYRAFSQRPEQVAA